MKNKILSFVLAFCLILPGVFMFSGCEHEHTFAETWTFNETHHWHASTCEGCDEKKDYAEHVDENTDDVCDVCNHGAVATIANKGYKTLEEAISAVEGTETVVLTQNIDLATAIIINKEVNIDLNNKNLTVTQDTAGDGVFQVVSGGYLTINGEGEVNGVGQNEWNIVIFANGGNVTINGGTYTNVGAVDTGTANGGDTHFDVIYAKNESKVTINGGTFMGQTPDWILNLHDGSRQGSAIEVKGGTFHGFNPANNSAEGENTNFVADGYTVDQDGDVYTVRRLKPFALIGSVEYNTLQEAINAVESGETIVLNENIDLPTAIVIDKEVTIDLNNKTLTVTQDTAGDGVFKVVFGGNLTINGEGEVNGVGNNPWNIVIFAYGGNVTINGGTYTNVGAVDEGTANGGDTHFDVIYAKTDGEGNGAHVTINGGTFMGQTPEWLLNLHDGSRETSSIEVKGGTFINFNPADNETEGAGTDFVPVGYTVEEYAQGPDYSEFIVVEIEF